MKSAIVNTLKWLALVAIVTYAADWAVFHLRLHRGTALDTVQVHQLVATPLKGQKMEYDYMGDAPETCSRSLFPQGGNPPCWWLRRHPSEWE